MRNPHQTRYERPQTAKFWIWKDTSIRYGAWFAREHGWDTSPWRWCCTFCEPPSYGFRVKQGAYLAIINGAMPRHFERRHAHHRHVRVYRRTGPPTCEMR